MSRSLKLLFDLNICFVKFTLITILYNLIFEIQICATLLWSFHGLLMAEDLEERDEEQEGNFMHPWALLKVKEKKWF